MGQGQHADAVPASCTTVGLAVAAWYGSNTLLLILNKWLMSMTGFRQPVFLTLAHMAASVAIGGATAAWGTMPLKPLRSSRQAAKLSLLAAIFCCSVVAGNASLRYIPISFAQAIGATTPFFTAMISLLVFKRESWQAYAALVPVVGGVIVASRFEPLFHVAGVTAAVAATGCRALKSVVQAMLLTDPSERLDPMSTLMYMSAASALLLLPATIALEPGAFAQAAQLAASNPNFLALLAADAALAYFVNLTNFLVTKYVGATGMQVLGNAKGVFAAAVSVAVFHNVVTPLGAVGYAITLAGVALYTRAKRAAITAAASSYGGGRVVEVLKGQQGSLALTVDSTPLLMDHETARPRTSPRPSGTGSKY